MTVQTIQEPMHNPSTDTPEKRREVSIFDVDVTLPGVQALLRVVVAVEKELRRAASSEENPPTRKRKLTTLSVCSNSAGDA
jgi:hypothetical protein